MTIEPITVALVLLLVHGALGAVDTFYSHEWREHLPRRPECATELALHGARSWMFAALFLGLAWLEWHGAWAWAPPLLIVVEYAITLADSVVEDRTRRLAPFERVNHMLLGLNTGLYFGFVAWQAVRWSALPTAVAAVRDPWLSELLTACALAVVAWAVRDGLASRRLAHARAGLAAAAATPGRR